MSNSLKVIDFLRNAKNFATEYVKAAFAINYGHLPTIELRFMAATLNRSKHLIDKNSAEILNTDAISIFTYEQLEEGYKTPSSDEIIARKSLSMSNYVVVFVPGSNNAASVLLARTYEAIMLQGGNVILFESEAMRDRLLEEKRMFLVHEINHLYNHPLYITNGLTIPEFTRRVVQNYQSEFRAYALTNYREIMPLSERASKCHSQIILKYPHISIPYNDPQTPDIGTEIDAFRRSYLESGGKLSGNTDNASQLPAWLSDEFGMVT